jgi:hypothetical protein
MKLLIFDNCLNACVLNKVRKITLLAMFASLLLVSFSTITTFVLAAKFTATMSGTNEVPPLNTTTSGYTSFRTASNDTVIKYKVNITGLSDVTGAQILQGKGGQKGDLVVDLLNDSKQNKIKLGMAIRGNITYSDLTGPMKGKTLDALLSALKAGDTYVNIITLPHPTGEIRGQIVSDSAKSTNLTGSANTNMTELGNTTS